MTNGKRSFDKHVGTWKWLTATGEGAFEDCSRPAMTLTSSHERGMKIISLVTVKPAFPSVVIQMKKSFRFLLRSFLSQVDLLLTIHCHRFNPLPFELVFLMRNPLFNKVRKESLICTFVESEWPIIITNLPMLFPFKAFTFASFTNLSTDTSSKIQQSTCLESSSRAESVCGWFSRESYSMESIEHSWHPHPKWLDWHECSQGPIVTHWKRPRRDQDHSFSSGWYWRRYCRSRTAAMVCIQGRTNCSIW